MKAADIADEAFLDAIRAVHSGRWESAGADDAHPLGTDNSHWIGASIWDIAAVLDGHPEWAGQPEATDGHSVSLPEKVVRAKARKLIQRGLVDGCGGAHECRGDYTIAAAGQ